jgi:cell division protein FtsW (lipid II flippase)
MFLFLLFVAVLVGLVLFFESQVQVQGSVQFSSFEFRIYSAINSVISFALAWIFLSGFKSWTLAEFILRLENAPICRYVIYEVRAKMKEKGWMEGGKK